jgi:predicted neuraminidase
LTIVFLGDAYSRGDAFRDGIVSEEFIYETASFPQCHASTIVQTSGGHLAAAWFGGTREGQVDVGIWFARHVDGKWSTPVEVATGVPAPDKRYPCWNPVLFQPREGPLVLFYKVGPSPSTWWGMMMTSQDGGPHWTAPQRLPDGILGPIKNKPIQRADGTLLCGSSTEHQGWRVHFEWTADLGRTWSRTEAINDGREIGAIQPTILSHPDGVLQALGRSRQGKIWEAWSRDQGKTWTPLALTALPNPNAGIDAVTLSDGRHVAVYNHTRSGRSPLNVAVSADGKDWKAAIVLEDTPGEYSYPAVIQAQDGLVHVTYTWKRQRVRHVVIDPARLRLRDMPERKWPE